MFTKVWYSLIKPLKIKWSYITYFVGYIMGGQTAAHQEKRNFTKFDFNINFWYRLPLLLLCEFIELAL